MKSFSIILPAYNEEGNIAKSVKEARNFLKKIFKDFEILVVNDGSRDKTAEILEGLKKEIPELRVLTHKTNLGYGRTVWDGIKAGKGKLLFFTDSDLQFDIREAKSFIKEIENYDVVLGYRKKRSEGFFRWLNAKGWKTIAFTLLGVRARDIDCAFKLFKKEVIDSIEVGSQGATFSAELLYKIDQKKYRVLQLPVDHFKRQFGRPTGAKLSVIIKSFKEIFNFYETQDNLVRSRSAIVYILGAIAIFLSRIIFISNSSDFFDSNEYRWRTVESSLMKAMTSGHAPYHPLYIFFSSLFYKWHFGGEILATTLPAVIFGALSIIVLFIIIKKLFSSQIAWLATTIYAFLPFILISQITILIDPVEHFFFFLSLLFIIASWNKKWLWFCVLSSLSGLSLSLAALAHTQVGFWVLIFPGIILLMKPKFNRVTWLKVLIGTVLVGIFASSAIFIYAKLLIYGEPLTPLGIHTFKQAINFLLFDNISEKSALSLSVAFARLDFLATSLVVILAIGGFFVMLRKEWVKLLGLLIWILPAILTSSYIHENLYGRAMVLALIPISILAAILILKLRKFSSFIFIVVMAQILLISIPAAITYKTKEAPNESLAAFQKQSEPAGVFISSNVTRTWNAYNGKFVSFGDVGVGAGTAYKEAEQALQIGKKAYLSSDAIYYPFWRYDGENFDFRARNIGGAGDHHTTLDEIFTKTNVTIERTSKDFKQSIYRITNSELSDKYQNIENIAKDKPVVFGRVVSDAKPVKDLTVNLYSDENCLRTKEDLTKNDIIACLYRRMVHSTSASNWSATDKDGWFYIANEVKNPKVIVAPIAVSTRSDSLGVQFASGQDKELLVKSPQSFDDANKLKEAINKINGSFYVIAKANSDKIDYQLNNVDFILEKTNRIEAETMGGEFGDTTRDKSASNNQARTNKSGGAIKSGYMLSGPYIDLPKGKYKISFSLCAKTIQEQDATIALDVTSAFSGEGFGTREFKASELSGYTPRSINFELTADAKSLEFRVKTNGKAEVLADYIELDKL